jgi:hypothetical protein
MGEGWFGILQKSADVDKTTPVDQDILIRDESINQWVPGQLSTIGDARYLLLDQNTPQTVINGTPIFNLGLTSNGTINILGSSHFGLGETSATDIFHTRKMEALTACWRYLAAWGNLTTEASFTGGTPITFNMSATTTYLYFGSETTFSELYFDLKAVATATPTLEWQYWNGSTWTTFTPSADTTTSLTVYNGLVTLGTLATWTSATITETAATGYATAPDQTSRYWVRLRRSAGTASTPTIYSIIPSSKYALAIYGNKNDVSTLLNIDPTGYLTIGDGVNKWFNNKSYAQAYLDYLYIGNITGYLSGETAGTVTTNGTAYANAINDGAGGGVPFMFGVQGTDIKTIFLSVASNTGAGANAWAQSQWNANVTSASSYYDSKYPGVQMLLGLGSNYGTNGSVSWYYHPKDPNFANVYNIAAISSTGMVIDHQLGAYFPRTAAARLDIFCEEATKVGMYIRAFTAQSADTIRIYDASDGTGTTYSTKFNALGRLGVGRGTTALGAMIETQSTGTTNEIANMINYGSAYWAGFSNRTSGTTAYSTELSSYVTFERSRGTTASPSAMLSGDRMGAVIFGGWLNAAWNRQSARIYGEATEAWVYSNPNYSMGTKLVFTTTPNGATASATKDVVRLTIDNDGTIFNSADSQKTMWGTGKDMSVYYDGTDGNIKTDEVAASDLNIVTGAAKTLELQTGVYEDLQFAISAAKVPAANYPDWETFTTNTSEYSFAVNDYIDCQANEVPHSWQEGTAGDFHLHLALKAAQNDGANRFAKFTIYTALSDPSQAGTKVWTELSANTAEATIANGTAALTGLYLDMGDITLTGYKIGTQIRVRIKRIAATGGTDYTGQIFITQCGIHLKRDTLGSRAEISK